MTDIIPTVTIKVLLTNNSEVKARRNITKVNINKKGAILLGAYEEKKEAAHIRREAGIIDESDNSKRLDHHS